MICKDDMAEIVPAVLICSSFDTTDSWSNGLPTERGLTKRVRTLGKAIGLTGLSAHDCRHYWATQAARNGTPVDRLQDAGGWNSPAMPLRYVEKAKISNQGVKLG
jgi:integrase